MHTDIDAAPGTFFVVGNGYFLPIVDVKARTQMTLGKKLSLSCMFDIYFVNVGEERVGFYFVSRFVVKNGGGYLLTHLAKAQEATECQTLIKTEHLVVYNYPNRGALAISPKVNGSIETIFLEQ